MLLYFDGAGRMTGSLTSAGYPAAPELIARVRGDTPVVVDVPPFEPRYWRWTGGELVIRPRLDLTMTESAGPDGAKLLVIVGVPAGGRIIVSGSAAGEIEADDEPTEIVFALGEYRIEITAEPHQPEVLNVAVRTEGS